MIQFIAANFAVLLLICGVLFVVGLVMRFVGKRIERKYTKIMHQHEWDMEPDEWEEWAREQGYRRQTR